MLTCFSKHYGHLLSLACAFGIIASVTACNNTAPAVEPASLVLQNGIIATVDPDQPEAQAIAIRGDTIAALGSNEEIQPFISAQTEVIDLRGQFAMPGFIEGHGHFMGLGQAKTILDLRDVRNWGEVVRLAGEAAERAKPGDWILGRGWHQEKWDRKPQPDVEGFPVHDSLSRVSTENPVLLIHASGHAGFVNAKAMELAGISRDTANPEGGEILKDKTGRPTGLLRESAKDLVEREFARWRSARSEEENRAEAHRMIQLAGDEAIANGVTSFQDAGADFNAIDILKDAAATGELKVRLWIMVRDSNVALRTKLAAYRAESQGKWLTVAGIKKTLDGALGSRGAWLLEPYSDLPGHLGLNTSPISEIEEAARIALDTGVQLSVHAIGDRANRTVLDMYEKAFESRQDLKDLRWRIEHAQHLSASDIPRFGRLGVIASMQGIHAVSDAPFVVARLGERRSQEGAYVWRELMNSGATVINGTDTPVESINPIAGFYASVTRKTKDGTAFYPDQRMTREQALKTYTWNAAYAAKEEQTKGSLTPGKLADITVLSKNILTVPDEEIVSTRVMYTISGGKIVYRAERNR